MSSQNHPSCGCAAVQGQRPGTCQETYFSCPVVCTPSVPPSDALPADACYVAHMMVIVLNILQHPEVLCETCDELDQLICVDRCSVPFTGQTITKIKLNLDNVANPCEGNLGCKLPALNLTIYEKCGTYWFKIPNALVLDRCYASDYPGDVGSVSITQPSGCPEVWQLRVMMDGFCYPINMKAEIKSELIAQCGCPPYLDYNLQLNVDSGFNSYMNSQHFQCGSLDALWVLAGQAMYTQALAIYWGYVYANLSEIKQACGCVGCNMGNSCNGAAESCAYSN